MQRSVNRPFDEWNMRNPIRDYNNILKLPILFNNSNYLNRIDPNLLVNQLIKGESNKKIIYENFGGSTNNNISANHEKNVNPRREEYNIKGSWITNSITKLKNNSEKDLTAKAVYF